jgi:nucleoid-associated protein YgaU
MSMFSRLTNAATMVPGLITSAPVRASLVPEEIGMPLLFHFNPAKVEMTKKSEPRGNKELIESPFQETVRQIGNLKIQLSECRFAGYTTKMAMDQLVEWATPQPKLSPFDVLASGADLLKTSIGNTVKTALMGGRASYLTTKSLRANGLLNKPVEYALPVLRFSWGIGGALGLGYKVTLEQVSISYGRFDPYGVPIFATVNLTMRDYTEPLPLTNPTSGGRPGRTKHMVTAGENVVGIAQRSYGSPNAWRALAEFNGMDDPLRVKPGKVLYLPGSAELEEGTRE